MLTAFKQHFTLNRNDFLVLPAFMAGGFLFGQLLLAIALSIEGPAEWFPIASLMTVISGIVAVLLMGGVGFAHSYRTALVMSRCRKPMLGAGFLHDLLLGILLAILTVPFMGLDLLIARLYRVPDQAALDVLRSLLRAPWVLLLAAPPLACSALFTGAVQSRVSRKVAVLLYILFLSSINLISPIITAVEEQPESLIARIFRMLAELPPVFWIAAVIALLGLMLWAAMRMLYTLRAEV